ncbi:MAG: histidine ammonia-lyase [Bacillota bacterium]
MGPVVINGTSLTLAEIGDVARSGRAVCVDPDALSRVARCRNMLESYLQENRAVYGITTGFGMFANRTISREQLRQLQANLIRSHSVAIGPLFPDDIVRGAMLLRANTFAKGYSGVRPVVLEQLVQALNRGVVPCVFEKGSLGASGDLAPLAHMALALMGEGRAKFGGEEMEASEALNLAGMTPLTYEAKEGLALINGTQFMTSSGALSVLDAETIMKTAEIAGALTLEALRGIKAPFEDRIHRLRPHPGQLRSAFNLRRLLEGSELVTGPGEIRVQDAYTLRCIPQVHGASWDALEYVTRVIEVEINSATDNPLVFPEHGDAVSGGNFHGQPVALALDFLAIAISEIANISERRIERLLNPSLSALPAFLTVNGGLDSGYMIAQYTAAALVSENKVLSSPASVDSIPVSANQEDHVSMGSISARKLREIISNTMTVLAIELMCACQARDLGQKGRMGIGTRRIYDLVRQYVPPLDRDRVLHDDVETVRRLVSSGEAVRVVEECTGNL